MRRGKKWRRLARVSCVMLGLGVFFTPIGSALGSLNLMPEGPDAVVPPEEEPGAADPGPAHQDVQRAERAVSPMLSRADIARARRLLRGDPRAQEFLRGRQFEVKDIGPWTDGDRLVGASLIIGFAKAQSSPMSPWPQVDYRSPVGGSDPYEKSVVKAAAEGVTELMIDVDLVKGEVVGVEPGGPHATLTAGPGATSTEPVERGY